MQVAFVWDGFAQTGLQIYVNGVAQGMIPGGSSAITTSLQGLHIGNATYQTAGAFNGRIAYLGVYQGRMLTAAQLTQFDQQLPITLDAVASTTENGNPTAVTTQTPGQDAQVSFTGWAGQQMTVQLSNNTIGAVNVSLIAPDGSTVTSQASSANAFSLPAANLSLNGVYSVLIHPTAGTSGSISVNVTAHKGVRSPGVVLDRTNPITQNLVGFYAMNERGGTSDTNLVDGRSANFSGASLPTWNMSDPSIAFGGGASLNSYLDSGADPAFTYLSQGKLTVIAKIFVPAVLGTAGIVEKIDNNAGFTFGIDSNARLQVGVWRPGTYSIGLTSATAVTPGQWMQVAFVWDGVAQSGLQIYVNGVAQSMTLTGTTALTTSAQGLHIGNATYQTPGALTGKIAYLAVYQGRLLTAAQLTQFDQQLPVSADVGGVTVENGGASSMTTTNATQDIQVGFNGWVAQPITVQLSNNTIGAVNVTLIAPDGSTVTSQASSATAFNLPAANLPLNGTYDVLVHPTAGTTGSITISVVGQQGVRAANAVLDDSSALAPYLIGLFQMNEGTGTSEINLVDGQPLTFAGASPPTWDLSDPAVFFNGGASLNSYLDAGSNPLFDNLSQNKITVVAKIQASSTAGGGIAEKTDSSSGFTFSFDSSGRLRVDVWKPGTLWYLISGFNAVVPGQWQQVAFEWDGTTWSSSSFKIFLNGVAQSTTLGGNSQPSIGAQSFRIGNSSFDTTASFPGRIAYAAVFRGRMLTTAELGQLDGQLPIDTIDFSGSVAPNTLAPVNITVPGQNARMLFNGTAGQLLTTWLSSSNLGSLTATILNTDGTVLSTMTSSAEAFAATQVTAPSTGVYAAYLHTNGTSTGSLNMSLAAPSAPVVAIASPANGSTVYLSSPPALTATASSTNGASVAQVQYFEGQTLLGTSVTSPYPVSLGTPSTGNHTYTAQVMDSYGVGVQSAPITVTFADPQVSSFTPLSGPVGTQVTVSGIGFGTTQGSSTVTFNGQAATSVISWSDTQVVAQVPVTAISGPVAVVANNIIASGPRSFTVPAPSIWSYTPGGGIAGTQVTINGTAFQDNRRDSTVTFNGVAGSVVSWSNTQIVANVPGAASTGLLHVVVNNVPDNSGVTFEVPNPVITSVTPPEAPAGGIITITGSGFGPYDPYAPTGFVNLNGSSGYISVVSWSDTSITAEVMDHATSGTLTIAKFDATSPGVPFQVEGPPSITNISPPVAPAGSTVTITGTGFGPSQSNSTLTFYGGAPATVISWSDTEIRAMVPPGVSTGPVGIAVGLIGGLTRNFIVSTTSQLTDSLGHTSTYTSQLLGGSWAGVKSTGSGCSSCTVRGEITNAVDSLGDVTSTTDELGHMTSFTYDSNFNMTSQSQQLDAQNTVTTSYTYNSFGEPLTVTDPLGNVTTNTYDANGNLLTVTSPVPATGVAASVTQFAYDPKGQLTTITDPLNHITTLAYYPTGLIHTITDAQSNVTSYEYDPRGNRTAVVDALQNRTTFTYDLGNRLTKITYPDTTFVSFGYDSRGRRTSVTDQNGKVTSYAYDDADRLISVTDAALNVTTYAYDLENNLTSITDAAQHTTSFVYDAFGRVTQTAFPSSLTENYVYDAVGNLTSKVDRKNQTILYVYDALNRLAHKTYPDATGVDYVYDLAGKIKQVSDPTGTYGFAYDNMGRLIGTTTQYSFLPGITYSNAYGYDAASNRTSFTAPDGSTNTYAYDTLNRLSTLTNSLTGQFGFSYDNLNRRTALSRPNGVNTTYGYDSLSRLLNVLHKAGTVTLDGAGYTYDNAGNRTAKTNYLNNITEQYTYDPLYQLTQVTQGTTTTESYSYDAVGNRLSSLGMSPYAYNSSNELTSTPAATFTYDANGNTLTKTDAAGMTTYNWDFENRLTQAVVPAVGTTTFRYDPFGRRIQKAGPNGTTNYVYDRANAIEEVDSAGNLVARYEQGPGIDQPLGALRSGANAFYEQDGVGSVTSLSSSTASLSTSYTYDTFGNLVSSTGSFVNPYLYTGRDLDSDTGLRYYRNRYYDSSVGRFLSEDALRYFGGGSNFYTYVANGPTNFRDPSGLKLDPQVGPLPQGGIDYADYLSALAYIQRDPVGNQIVALLEASSVTYAIVFDHSQDTYFDDKTNTIHWDPRSGVRICDSGILTPALSLFHEMVHARRGKRHPTPDAQWDDSEEKLVIQDFEIPFALRNGEPVRANHGDFPRLVIGSTSAIPTPGNTMGDRAAPKPVPLPPQ
jgi:RHS repeat-associated protein